MKNEKRFTENYSETIKACAQLILDAAPRGMTPRRRAEVQQMADTGVMGWGLSVDFSRAAGSATCVLSIGLDSVDYKGKEDSEGNLWSEYKLETKVNWSSWGSTEPGLALTRLELMREVAVFAAEVQATFQCYPIMKMQETKAERDESARQAEAARILRLIETICNGSLKGLRIGGETIVLREDHGVPPGSYTFEQNSKTYAAIITSTHGFAVTRAS